MTEQAQTPQKPLPCPFCGNEKVSIREGSTYRWARAECDVCGAAAGDIRRQYGQGVDDPEVQTAAIAEWNIRDRREIDRLEAEIEAWRDERTRMRHAMAAAGILNQFFADEAAARAKKAQA